MEKGYTGWIVEWGDLTSRKRGIVVSETDRETIVIFDENGSDTVEVSLETRLVKIKPADISDIKLQQNIRKGLKKWERSDPDTHDTFVAILKGLEERGLSSVKALAKSASSEVLESSKKSGKGKTSPAKLKKASSRDDCDDSDSEEEEEEDEDEEEGEDEEEDEEDEDEEDEDEEDEDDDEDSSEDEEESSDEEESEEDSEEDESSDDSDEERIDLKVYIALPRAGGDRKSSEVRGFSIAKDKVLHRIKKTLTADYHLTPRLFYRDQEGDDVLIRRQSDFKYALKAHEKSDMAESKLKLYAKFEEDGSTVSSNISMAADTPDRAPKGKCVGSAWDAVDSPIISKHSMLGEGSSLHSGGEFLWQKGELVGSGSFGQVFGGIHLESGRRIAVKEVHLSASKGHMDQARALQIEIKVLSALDHPNIIKYHGGESICVLYLLLEVLT
jgi:hypothetical protein